MFCHLHFYSPSSFFPGRSNCLNAYISIRALEKGGLGKRRKAIDICLEKKGVQRGQSGSLIGMTTWLYQCKQPNQDIFVGSNNTIKTTVQWKNHWKVSSETCYSSVSITLHSLPDFAYTSFSMPPTFKLISRHFWFPLPVPLQNFKYHVHNSLFF